MRHRMATCRIYSTLYKTLTMGFHINDKKNKPGGKNAKQGPQAGSKFIAKPSTKAAGAVKKPIKTGGARGS